MNEQKGNTLLMRLEKSSCACEESDDNTHEADVLFAAVRSKPLVSGAWILREDLVKSCLL